MPIPPEMTPDRQLVYAQRVFSKARNRQILSAITFLAIIAFGAMSAIAQTLKGGEFAFVLIALAVSAYTFRLSGKRATAARWLAQDARETQQRTAGD